MINIIRKCRFDSSAASIVDEILVPVRLNSFSMIENSLVKVEYVQEKENE